MRLFSHPLIARYRTSAAFRVHVSLYLSLGIHLVYVSIKLITGILYHSFWFDAVAVYYLLLIWIRFVLLRSLRRRKTLLEEYRRFRMCGLLLIVLNLALTGVVAMLIARNADHQYPLILVIAMAAYTFYAVTMSIIDLIRYRKHERPTVTAARLIRFTAALVSLLSLQTSILTVLGDDDSFRRWMTGVTGTGICLIVLALSVYMIVKANRFIAKYNGDK